jgi:hypothetical protein
MNWFPKSSGKICAMKYASVRRPAPKIFAMTICWKKVSAKSEAAITVKASAADRVVCLSNVPKWPPETRRTAQCSEFYH